MWVQSLGWEDPLEEEMATHSGILDERIPWTEDPGGLQSMGSQRVTVLCPAEFSLIQSPCMPVLPPFPLEISSITAQI